MKPNEWHKLSEEDTEKVKEWIYRHKHNSTCPVCATASMVLGDYLVAIPTTDKRGNTYLGGPSYPAAILVCEKCGYVMMFNSMVMGLEKKEAQK